MHLTTQELTKTLKEHSDLLKVYSDRLNNILQLIESTKKNLIASTPLTIQHGWYLTWLMTVSLQQIDENNIDAKMTKWLEDYWDNFKNGLISRNPTRKDILSEAFKLHEEGRYFASIPLFFSQADGICQDRLGGTSYFSGRTKAAEKIIQLYKLREGSNFPNMNFFLDPLREKTTINIASSEVATPGSTPNRHGIMHGDPKHMNYGSKINSLKAYSFLLSVQILLDYVERTDI
jgi:hypothetical protein